MHIACMQKSALTKFVPLQWTKGVLIHRAPAEPDFAIECLTEIAAHIIGCI